MSSKIFFHKQLDKQGIANRFAKYCLAVLSLGILVSCSFQGGEESQADGLDRELLALLPPDVASLTSFDVLRLKSMPLYRLSVEEDRKNKRPGGDRKTVAGKTSFDPWRDIDMLLAAAWVEGSRDKLDTLPTLVLLVARGRFHATGGIGRELNNAEVENHRGFDVYHRPAVALSDFLPQTLDSIFLTQFDDGFSLVLFDGEIAVAGVRPIVMQTIDRYIDDDPNLLGNTQLIERAEVLSVSNQAWSVFLDIGDLWESQVHKFPRGINIPVARVFRAISISTIAVNLTDGIDVKAEGICATPQDARTLVNVSRGMVGLGRFALSRQYPVVMNLLKNIDLVDDGMTFRASLKMTVSEFEKTLASLKREQ